MNKVDDQIGDCFCGSGVRVLISLCTSMLTVSAAHRWWGGSQMSGDGDRGDCRGQEQPEKVESYTRPLQTFFPTRS